MKSWTCPRLGLAEQHGFLVDPLLYIDNPVETLIRNESNPSKFGQHPTSRIKLRRIAGVNQVCGIRVEILCAKKVNAGV